MIEPASLIAAFFCWMCSITRSLMSCFRSRAESTACFFLLDSVPGAWCYSARYLTTGPSRCLTMEPSSSVLRVTRYDDRGVSNDRVSMTMRYPPSCCASGCVLVGRRRVFQPVVRPDAATPLCGQRCERAARGLLAGPGHARCPAGAGGTLPSRIRAIHTGFERVNVPTEPPDVGWTARATLTMHVGTDDDAYVVK